MPKFELVFSGLTRFEERLVPPEISEILMLVVEELDFPLLCSACIFVMGTQREA
jgi:hypothetical protein